ncbi:MAG: DUF5895 domain-containing protein [Methylacidiphilales bacterium]|nr:DUF5895 domain-containing protein [Candidatus Methylacidiphilales bacterium]
MDFIDKWRDSKYESEVSAPSLAFCQWNAKKIAIPGMLISMRQAEAAGWQNGAPGWEKRKFSYESGAEEEVLACKNPILAVLRVHKLTLVFRDAHNGHKKGDPKPDHEPYDKRLHIPRRTYTVGFLAPNGQGGYRLLHTEPIAWTPKGVAGAKFSLECYGPFRQAIRAIFGADVPGFIFALRLVGQPWQLPEGTKIQVPALVDGVPHDKAAFQPLYVGDETAATLALWYRDLYDEPETGIEPQQTLEEDEIPY